MYPSPTPKRRRTMYVERSLSPDRELMQHRIETLEAKIMALEKKARWWDHWYHDWNEFFLGIWYLLGEAVKGVRRMRAAEGQANVAVANVANV